MERCLHCASHMENYHLVPNGELWELKTVGGKFIAEYTTKEEAVTDSRYFVERQRGSLKIHKADGTIEEERSYPRSADPAKSPG